MRVEPHAVGSIVHVTKRGAKGLPITRDTKDRARFRNLLFYFNDLYRDEYWERSTEVLSEFERPDSWPERNPLVKILAWSLMSNHFHLVLKEMQKGGVSKFMQRVCGSMSAHFNAKYNEQGSIFQGSYKARTADIHGDNYLRLLAVYVMVKNPFELYPGGLLKAINNFEAAYEWASKRSNSSLSCYAHTESAIVDKDIFGEIFESPAQFKKFAKDCLMTKLDQLSMIEKMEKSDFSKNAKMARNKKNVK